MSVNPYDSPLTQNTPTPKPVRRGFRLWELLAVVGIIGLLVAMLLPTVRVAREPALRASCSNNLKHIGIALLNYQDEFGAFPPAYTVDANGKPLHSWRTLILPYLEQGPLYERIDLKKPWDDPANQSARDTKVQTYQCPSANTPEGKTTYLAVVGPNSVLQAAQPRSAEEIADDKGLTMLVIEVDPEHAVHWMSPEDATEAQVVSFASAKPLAHPGGTHAAFADGSIRFLPESIQQPAVLRALISVAGGDDDVVRQVD
jgi:prepilin-type processing-associated H-X9-DG protein